MSREEWLLAEEIETELRLSNDALGKLDGLERSYSRMSEVDADADNHKIAIHVLEYHLQRTLRAIGALAERLGTPSIEREVSALRQDRAKLQATTREYDDLHSEALAIARSCFAPLRAMTDAHKVTAQDVFRNIISKTAVMLGNMGKAPTSEAEVRNAVFEVCSYSFPDAIKEVGIPKLLKTYKGDLGIPSLRTMVEFKFITSPAEMKAALDGVYADMKGYNHPDWDTFYGVFYMTEPFYTQDDVEREFKFVGADRSWTPIVVQGRGARKIKSAAKTKT
ncbi:hypothetical protein [Pseudoduganella rhizocola]|uniref:hypothetical protein n=1 Tax=Pseudoduganella rhizocola TaxID=3382643 RepID=UPI0038B5D5D2